MVSYGARIGERLDETVQQLFPEMTSRQASISHVGGWAAGRAAADQARLGVRQEVAG